jgi:concanavalin A-like lectin/glucanase superfamily protein
VLSTFTLALNQWYYVAATYHGPARTATIYVNGATDAQAVLPGFTPNTSADLYLARASWYAGYYVHAALDEMRFEAVAQTAAEIVSDYQSFPAPTAPPAAVPLAEWLLDDTGATLADASGNGHTATAFGSASTAGVRNGARAFNGVAERAEVPAAASLSPASFTVRAWVRLTALPTGWGVLVSNYGGNYQGWYLGVHASGQLIFSVAALPASAPWLVSMATLSPGLWYHVSATYDGASRIGTLYLNGAPDTAAVFPGFTPQASLPLTFARASWYDGYYASVTLDEVRMMPVAQFPSEVLADYQSFP